MASARRNKFMILSVIAVIVGGRILTKEKRALELGESVSKLYNAVPS